MNQNVAHNEQHVAAQMRERMKQRDVPLRTVAEAIGCSVSQAHRFASGTHCISAAALPKIAEALDVSVEFFFAGLQPIETRSISEGRQRDFAEFAEYHRRASPRRRRLLRALLAEIVAAERESAETTERQAAE